jgi:hypothetical protein
MDLFAALFIQDVFDTPEAEPTPANPIEAGLDGGNSNGRIVA